MDYQSYWHWQSRFVTMEAELMVYQLRTKARLRMQLR